MRFNTGIAAMMEFVNGAYKWEQRPKLALEQFVLLLAPYAPHLAEEMWQVHQHALHLYGKLEGVRYYITSLCFHAPGFTCESATTCML